VPINSRLNKCFCLLQDAILILINKLTSVFLCICPVIDHEIRHNIVKVAVDPQTTLNMLWRNSLSITGQMHYKLTSICFFYNNKLSNRPLLLADASHKFQIHVPLHILTIKISQWAHVNFCSYCQNTVCIWCCHTCTCMYSLQQLTLSTGDCKTVVQHKAVQALLHTWNTQAYFTVLLTVLTIIAELFFRNHAS